MFPIIMNQCSRFIPHWLLIGSIGWIVSFGLLGTAVVPFMTGALSQKFGIVSLQPLYVSTRVCGRCWTLTRISKVVNNASRHDGNLDFHTCSRQEGRILEANNTCTFTHGNGDVEIRHSTTEQLFYGLTTSMEMNLTNSRNTIDCLNFPSLGFVVLCLSLRINTGIEWIVRIYKVYMKSGEQAEKTRLPRSIL